MDEKLEITNKAQFELLPIDECLNQHKKSLTERIEAIKIPKEQEDKIRNEYAFKTLKDKVLGSFKPLELITTLGDWNKGVNQEIKDYKQKYLLNMYFEKTESNENKINLLIDFVNNPIGNTLFNKIIQILDNEPPDQELTQHLAGALKYIIEKTDFVKHFDKHKYALAEIGRLNPLALTMLHDYPNWSEVTLETDGWLPGKVGGVMSFYWLENFARLYCQSKGINDSAFIERVRHSTKILWDNRHIEYSEEDFTEPVTKVIFRTQLTTLGREIAEYINS